MKKKSLNAPNAEAMLLSGLSARLILQWVAVQAIKHLRALRQDHVRAVPAQPIIYPDMPDSLINRFEFPLKLTPSQAAEIALAISVQ